MLEVVPSWVQRLSLVAFGAAATSVGVQPLGSAAGRASHEVVRGLPGSPPNITYLAMMPGSHGKPGLQNIGNVTIAFSDWRLRRSVDGGRSFGPVVELPDKTDARCLNPSDGVVRHFPRSPLIFVFSGCFSHRSLAFLHRCWRTR